MKSREILIALKDSISRNYNKLSNTMQTYKPQIDRITNGAMMGTAYGMGASQAYSFFHPALIVEPTLTGAFLGYASLYPKRAIGFLAVMAALGAGLEQYEKYQAQSARPK